MWKMFKTFTRGIRTMARLTSEESIKRDILILKMIKEGKTSRTISNELNCSLSTISKVRNRGKKQEKKTIVLKNDIVKNDIDTNDINYDTVITNDIGYQQYKHILAYGISSAPISIKLRLCVFILTGQSKSRTIDEYGEIIKKFL